MKTFFLNVGIINISRAYQTVCDVDHLQSCETLLSADWKCNANGAIFSSPAINSFPEYKQHRGCSVKNFLLLSRHREVNHLPVTRSSLLSINCQHPFIFKQIFFMKKTINFSILEGLKTLFGKLKYGKKCFAYLRGSCYSFRYLQL